MASSNDGANFFAKLYRKKIEFLCVYFNILWSKKPNIKVNSNVEINILGKNNSAISYAVMCKKYYFTIPKHHKVMWLLVILYILARCPNSSQFLTLNHDISYIFKNIFRGCYCNSLNCITDLYVSLVVSVIKSHCVKDFFIRKICYLCCLT